MLIDRYADDVVVWAPAKVNLYLEVLGKRADGYHEVETLMVPVSLYDTLTIAPAPSGSTRLSCPGVPLSTGPENLIVRAADHLRRQALLRGKPGGSLGADVVLTKRIPLAAGLAGGSTDAAACSSCWARWPPPRAPSRCLSRRRSRLARAM